MGKPRKGGSGKNIKEVRIGTKDYALERIGGIVPYFI